MAKCAIDGLERETVDSHGGARSLKCCVTDLADALWSGMHQPTCAVWELCAVTRVNLFEAFQEYDLIA